MPNKPTDLSHYIDSSQAGKPPFLRGHLLTVAEVAYGRHYQGMDITQLMKTFTLTETEVLAALLYYAEHRDEINALEQADNEPEDSLLWEDE
jgi:uncharacterized protein (DUF433 family)